MIHQVPLKSLPQEWLWCETWCDDASKPAAKTIDLVSWKEKVIYHESNGTKNAAAKALFLLPS